MIEDTANRSGEPRYFLVPEDEVFYIEAEERGNRVRYWMFRQLADAEKCLLFLNHQGGLSPSSPPFWWYRRGLHPRVSLSKPDPEKAPGRVSLTVDSEPTDRGWTGASDAVSLSHILLLSREELEYELRQHVSSSAMHPLAGTRGTDVAGPTPSTDPHLDKLISRWQRWRRIYTSAGQPAHDEPRWEAGRLHLRHGYPLPGWTSYIVDPADGGYYVLTATTERRNSPLEASAGFFTDADDVSKYIIWTLGETLRMNRRLDPIAWAWEDSGLDARVRWTPRAEFVSKYELIADPSRYFILRTGGIQPENRLLPLTYDELVDQLLDGMPEELRSETSPLPPKLKPSSAGGNTPTKPSEGHQHAD